jgi:hypothetical protein
MVKEAIFLASPSLYSEIEKWINKQITDKFKSEKIEQSFLKYISRMTSRCTPFGLFAGCSIGSFQNKQQIELKNNSDFNRQTRFDMNFLVAFALELANKPTIKKQLLFYPNTSIYKAGNHLRYIEYKYIKNSRIHSIEAVSDTEYLNTILEKATAGKTLNDLTLLLIDDNIDFEEANTFIEELVENQLLVSELEPSVSGPDFLEQIIETLEKLEETDDLVQTLKTFFNQLEDLDKTLGNSVENYKNIGAIIKTLKVDFEFKYLFQTDLFPKLKSNNLSNQSINSVKKGLVLLNKMTVFTPKINLENFRRAFVKRYEDREIPLALALDIEMGIGYIQNRFAADDTPFFDDLYLPQKAKDQQSKYWNNVQEILDKKLLESAVNKLYEIQLTDEDFKDLDEDWTNLPDTISTLAEVLLIDGKEMIFFDSVGGSSAANLLGRFCNGSTDLLEHTKTIIAKETALQSSKILAEIVHLPQSRTGNILKRPQFRAYEIPYLAKSTVSKNNQISINDLMVSVKGHRIFLRSKKLNKEVIPHLTNAHNYSNGLPIYHFLCDLQTQNQRSSLYFSWGNAAINHTFLPRVIYDSVIFSKASWIISKSEIAEFLKLQNESGILLKTIKKWQIKLRLPKYVQLVESDNTLLINLENTTSIKMWLQTVKNKNTSVLEEFLFDNDGVIKSKNGYYTNQVVFSFYKRE